MSVTISHSRLKGKSCSITNRIILGSRSSSVKIVIMVLTIFPTWGHTGSLCMRGKCFSALNVTTPPHGTSPCWHTWGWCMECSRRGANTSQMGRHSSVKGVVWPPSPRSCMMHTRQLPTVTLPPGLWGWMAGWAPLPADQAGAGLGATIQNQEITLNKNWRNISVANLWNYNTLHYLTF